MDSRFRRRIMMAAMVFGLALSILYVLSTHSVDRAKQGATDVSSHPTGSLTATAAAK